LDQGFVVSIAEGAPVEFRGLLLCFRGRTGLTQTQLAGRVAVHPRSVQAWEAGLSYPSTARLQTLLEVLLDAGGFAPGHAAEDAEALWCAAESESPRLRAPFDAQVVKVMADARRPISFRGISSELAQRASRTDVLEAVEGLCHRSLVYCSTGSGGELVLRSAVSEYVTDRGLALVS